MQNSVIKLGVNEILKQLKQLKNTIVYKNIIEIAKEGEYFHGKNWLKIYIDEIVSDLYHVQQFIQHHDKYYAFTFSIDYAPCIIRAKGCDKKIYNWKNNKINDNNL